MIAFRAFYIKAIPVSFWYFHWRGWEGGNGNSTAAMVLCFTAKFHSVILAVNGWSFRHVSTQLQEVVFARFS